MVGAKETWKTAGLAHSGLHCLAYPSHPLESLPLPTIAFPFFRAYGSPFLFHASSLATPALTDPLPFGGARESPSWQQEQRLFFL